MFDPRWQQSVGGSSVFLASGKRLLTSLRLKCLMGGVESATSKVIELYNCAKDENEGAEPRVGPLL